MQVTIDSWETHKRKNVGTHEFSISCTCAYDFEFLIGSHLRRIMHLMSSKFIGNMHFGFVSVSKLSNFYITDVWLNIIYQYDANPKDF